MKWKAAEFTVESTEEFEEMVMAKDFRIATAIVEGIFANIDSKRKNIHLISVIVEPENSIFDITIEKKHFAETLEENLPYYVREERYEDCQRIVDVIDNLKKAPISDILGQIANKK